MSGTDTRFDEVIKKLDEVIDLLKNAKQPTKVENHTHHHYPTYPQYTYPFTWTTGGTTGTTPGTTTTWTSNGPTT